MTLHSPIHKDRVAYCSQNYDDIRLHCPVCLINKIPRHCKIHKNLASLWWHIKREHKGFVYSQFDYDDVLTVLNGVTRAIQWGIILK